MNHPRLKDALTDLKRILPDPAEERTRGELIQACTEILARFREHNANAMTSAMVRGPSDPAFGFKRL